MGDDQLFPADRVTVMGVLNVTPDSFSDGGRLLGSSGDICLDRSLAAAHALVEAGAHMIDVGGESTRPGAGEVGVQEEIDRTAGVIEKLAQDLDVPISIDSRRTPVVRCAIEAGARVVNDISGLSSDATLAAEVAEAGSTLILGHLRGTPATMQDSPGYEDVLEEVALELARSVEQARAAGVASRNLVVDPGIGFGKRFEDNLELIAHIGWLKGRLGLPVMVGASRKAFLGSITGEAVADREFASHAACAVAAFGGADAVRVHDPAGALRAVQVGRALGSARRKELA
ncbi:MAG: dihydropteroate synthase [Myxococcota bacterium]|nr:dihydropteroate synthase [Myxococcota bacterium]